MMKVAEITASTTLQNTADKYDNEPPRVYRRLHYLREWSYEQENEIFPGSAGTGSPAII